MKCKYCEMNTPRQAVTPARPHCQEGTYLGSKINPVPEEATYQQFLHLTFLAMIADLCNPDNILKWLKISKTFFLAHLSWKLKWAFLITCRPSSVCLSVRPPVRPSVCKLFTFSSSSPEPLGQFQPILAQSILGWRGFKFVQMKNQ